MVQNRPVPAVCGLSNEFTGLRSQPNKPVAYNLKAVQKQHMMRGAGHVNSHLACLEMCQAELRASTHVTRADTATSRACRYCINEASDRV